MHRQAPNFTGGQENDVLTLHDVEGFSGIAMDMERWSKPGGSEASSKEKAWSVSEPSAFTDIVNPPRSIDRPSPFWRTNASTTPPGSLRISRGSETLSVRREKRGP